MTSVEDASKFFEKNEFIKLYKYSVPLFFEKSGSETLVDTFQKKNIPEFNPSTFEPVYEIDTEIVNGRPAYYKPHDDIILKFVLQKTTFDPTTGDQCDYRYPVSIYFDELNSVLDIRFDALKNESAVKSRDFYERLILDVAFWIKANLGLKLYLCDHSEVISAVNDKSDESVKMYRQMVQYSSGGSAELTTSPNQDYVIPFIGELRELIDENEELFNSSPDIKDLIMGYLEDKEATANYTYIYIKWIKPVESQSFIIKVTFDFFSQKYTVLQHLAGNCPDLEMGRMNDAIKYLCSKNAFSRGNEF